MTVWIVVESMFGNTHEVAEQMAAGVRLALATTSVQVRDVANAGVVLPDDVTLLIVGGPTHAFGMSRESTREDAHRRGSTAETAMGVREWLDLVTISQEQLPVVAFDTRVDRHFVPGSAAKAIARRLRRLGCYLLEAPVTFYVDDTTGPLADGEQERAYAFGQMAARDFARRSGLVA
jgi:hypothetical protein